MPLMVSMRNTTRVQSTGKGFDGMPSMAILPPMTRLSTICRKAEGTPLISSPTSKPSRKPEPCHDGRQFFLGHIDRHHVGDLGRERQPGRVDVGDDDVPRPDVPRHGGRHDADRPGAGDQHVLADEIERQGRMHRIAERIQDGAELVVDVIGQTARC